TDISTLSLPDALPICLGFKTRNFFGRKAVVQDPEIGELQVFHELAVLVSDREDHIDQVRAGDKRPAGREVVRRRLLGRADNIGGGRLRSARSRGRLGLGRSPATNNGPYRKNTEDIGKHDGKSISLHYSLQSSPSRPYPPEKLL